VSVEEKMDELLLLLENSNMDNKSIIKLQERFNTAVEQNKASTGKFKVFEELDEVNATRLELAENLENLLSMYELDSKVSQKYINAERLLKFVLMITSMLLIAFGFALIVMPATPEFEMFTIFHFTRDDGFTLMDLIALLIVFTGVYLFIRSVVKTNWQD
jgi:hypothetical protein